MSDLPHKNAPTTRRRARRPGEPSRRNCTIYERHVLGGETQVQLAAEFGISQQRVGQIAARVEGWLATHGDHPLAARMRLRTNRRWDTIWSLAIDGFDRSREDRQVKKERTTRPAKSGEAEPPVLSVTEITTREQNGDPRYLALAVRIAEREDRRWQQTEPRSRAGQSRALTKLEERVAALEAEEREWPDLDDVPPAETTATAEKGEDFARPEAVPCATVPHPHTGSLPEGKGAEASCASPGELEAIAATARSEKEKDLVRRLAEATYQPAPWEEWCYVSEWQFDRISEMLKLRGDREGWKNRQKELRRDLATMIRLEWPDVGAVPSEKTTTLPREKRNIPSSAKQPEMALQHARTCNAT